MPRPSRWNEIVDAAAQAFMEQGFAATSLEDIANEVGIWKGSLYHYINSKEDLLFAVVRGPADRILSDLQQLVVMDLPPAEKLRRAMRSHGAVLDTLFVYASVYLAEIAGRHRWSEWNERDREYLRCLESVIAEGVDKGDFDPAISPRIATLGLIGALNWLTHWYRPDGELSAVEIADRFADLFLGGLLRRGSVGIGVGSTAQRSDESINELSLVAATLERPRPSKRPSTTRRAKAGEARAAKTSPDADSDASTKPAARRAAGRTKPGPKG